MVSERSKRVGAFGGLHITSESIKKFWEFLRKLADGVSVNASERMQS